MSLYKTLKDESYESNMELNKLGLVVYTFGNVSAADQSKGVFAIKPSGLPYQELRPEDMVVLDFENNIIEGKLKPSSDTKTHSHLYRNWKNLGGIAHSHSTFAVSWAQAQMDIPIFGTTHADHLTQDIPCTPPMEDHLIEGNYEHNTGIQILECFANRELSYEEVEMILVGSHGPFSWGTSAAKAVYNNKVMEKVAEMAYLTLQINPNADRLKSSLIKKHYERKHGINSYYGQ